MRRSSSDTISKMFGRRIDVRHGAKLLACCPAAPQSSWEPGAGHGRLKCDAIAGNVAVPGTRGTDMCVRSVMPLRAIRSPGNQRPDMCVRSVMQSRAMRTSAMRGAAALIASAVIAVGCGGGGSLPPVEEPVGASDESEQPVPARAGVTRPGRQRSPSGRSRAMPPDPAAEIGQEPPLAGLYDDGFSRRAAMTAPGGRHPGDRATVRRTSTELDATDGRTVRACPTGTCSATFVRLPRASRALRLRTPET